MGAVQVQRTLVKSLPEVWAQLSETELLAPLFGDTFGEIAITRLDAETRIEWEGERANGFVELEPSGFGTRVRLTALVEDPPPPPEPEPEPRRSWLARLLRRPAPAAPEPEPVPEPEPLLEPAAAHSALSFLLDEVGAARHRPFSRRD
jgi:hypothetical protein